MKKILFLIVILVMLPGSALALQWATPSQDTIQWDPVEMVGITYRVYMAPFGQHENANLIGDTVETTYTVSFDQWGEFVVGVSAVLQAGLPTEQESPINWSDVNGISTPEPFAYRVIWAPINLRRMGTP